MREAAYVMSSWSFFTQDFTNSALNVGSLVGELILTHVLWNELKESKSKPFVKLINHQ